MQKVVQSSYDIIWEMDLANPTIVYISGQCIEKILGFRTDEMIGRSTDGVCSSNRIFERLRKHFSEVSENKNHFQEFEDA
jgi:hypothetical protein